MEYCITKDAISLMKIYLLEGGSNDAIINNNDELVSITSESKKLITKYFTGVIFFESYSSKIGSKTRNWKPPKRSRRLGRRNDARDYKSRTNIAGTHRIVLAPPTHSRRARRKMTMATLKSQLSSARRQTSIATRTCRSTAELLSKQKHKTMSLKSSCDNQRSKMNDACLMLRVSRKRERVLSKQIDFSNSKNEVLARTIVVMEEEIEEKVEVSSVTHMHSTQIRFDRTLKLTFFNIVIVHLQFAVAQTTAKLNENHNKKMNKNDSKHKDVMNRHKISHEKSLNALAKQSEKKANTTVREVNNEKKRYQKESSDTIMELTQQSKQLISKVKCLKKTHTLQTRSMEKIIVTLRKSSEKSARSMEKSLVTLRKSSEKSVSASDKFHVMELNKMQNEHEKQIQQIEDAQNTKLRNAEKFHSKQMKVSQQTK